MASLKLLAIILSEKMELNEKVNQRQHGSMTIAPLVFFEKVEPKI
jgi:hypothetical protein